MGSRSTLVVAFLFVQAFALAWVPEQTTCSVTKRMVESNVISHRAQRKPHVVSLLNATWQLGDPEELEFELNDQTYVNISPFSILDRLISAN